MESPARNAEEASSSVTAIRRFAVGALLVAAAFAQRPGQLVADTKFDLVIDPGLFLQRAAHLWDPVAGLGQLSNQSYGYWWPMGPFFWVGQQVGIDGWIIQRLWMSLVLVVAFFGVVKVAQALGVASDFGQIAAGLSYALAPRVLTTLGVISIEAWPGALAPWVLWVIIQGTRTGSPYRAAALAGVLVGMAGGVNAAASAAVLPMGMIWLLTRKRSLRRRVMLIWWPIFTAMACFWWLVPLVVLGRYSPPFLDFIEQASLTTAFATAFDVLRGSSHWVPYISAYSDAGSQLISNPVMIANGVVVTGAGLLGLALAQVPERRFLLFTLLTGLVMVNAGHMGAMTGWASGGFQQLLDGLLSAVRNVHKFDPVVRLPMAVGVGYVAQLALASTLSGMAAMRRRPVPKHSAPQHSAPQESALQNSAPQHCAPKHAVPNFVASGSLVALLTVALAGSMAPLYLGQAAAYGDVSEVPQYWRESADWLNEQPGTGAVLVAPASRFGEYLWGRPRDEPFQSLLTRPWTVRSIVPLTPPGNIRVLDSIQDRLTAGRGSRGLALALRRAGIGYVVLRHDLAGADGLEQDEDYVPSVLVRRALLDTPGLSLSKTFGPLLGSPPVVEMKGIRRVVNQGWSQELQAIEVFALDRPAQVMDFSAQDPPVVVGGPEDLIWLDEVGVLQGQATRMAYDTDPDSSPGSPLILTDGLQDRARDFPRLAKAYSALLAPGDRERFGKLRDYLPAEATRWLSRATYRGAKQITASSALSDDGRVLGAAPFAAIDGDPQTFWESRISDGAPRWRVALEESKAIEAVEIRVPATQGGSQSLRVLTAAGSTDAIQFLPGAQQRIQLPEGSTDFVEVVREPGSFEPLALAEISIPEVSVRRVVELPEVPAAWGVPRVIGLHSGDLPTPQCLALGVGVQCIPGAVSRGEDDGGLVRRISMVRAASYDATMQVRPRGDLTDLIQQGRLVNLEASSQAVPDPRGSALMVADGDKASTWVGAPEDLSPSLRVSWLSKQRISKISVKLRDSSPARAPSAVRLSWPGGTQQGTLKDGQLKIKPIRTKRLNIQFTSRQPAERILPSGERAPVGIGVSELSLAGAPLTAPLSRRIEDLGCGSGPEITVGSQVLQTAVQASEMQLREQVALPAVVCTNARVRLKRGANEVEVRNSSNFRAMTVVLKQGLSVPPGAPLDSAAEADGQSITAVAPAGAGVVRHRMNFNDGWVATSGEKRLSAVRIDGWQQGWELLPDPGDSQLLVARYAPDRVYRWGLLAGMVLACALLLVLLMLRIRETAVDSSEGEVAPSAQPTAGGRLGAVIALGAVGLVGGWLGLLCAVVGAGVRWRLAVAQEAIVLSWLVAGSLTVVGAGYVLFPWGRWDQPWFGSYQWPQFLTLAVVGLVVSPLLFAGASSEASRQVSPRTDR